MTIIETTKGYVFGAYGTVDWDFARNKGPTHFIFSLINASRVLQLIRPKNNKQDSLFASMLSSRIFGFEDIVISDNSYSSDKSFSDLGKSFDFKLFSRGTVEAKSFLAGSPNFQTREIEVFQLS